MSDSSAGAPPPDVQRAFGASGPVERFSSGAGTTFRVGELVLKPAAEPREAAWIGDVLETVIEHGCRVARPVRAGSGSWVFDGWTAWRWVEGSSTRERWDDVIAAGARFHEALRDIPRPEFMNERAHQWAVGDRVAFGETRVELPEPIEEQVAQILGHLGQLDLPSQVVHGDLAENVLLADGLAPAIIDFSPYYRPTGFADAVVVVDAVAWFGAPTSLVDVIRPAVGRYELLARALIFRLVAAALPRTHDASGRRVQADAHQPLVDHVVEALARRRSR